MRAEINANFVRGITLHFIYARILFNHVKMEVHGAPTMHEQTGESRTTSIFAHVFADFSAMFCGVLAFESLQPPLGSVIHVWCVHRLPAHGGVMAQ